MDLFVDENLKRCSCGIPCRHLQCSMNCCEHAAAMANGQLKIVMRHKQSIVSLIQNSQWFEALDITYDLLKHNLINERRFEMFRVKFFSCEI